MTTEGEDNDYKLNYSTTNFYSLSKAESYTQAHRRLLGSTAVHGKILLVLNNISKNRWILKAASF